MEKPKPSKIAPDTDLWVWEPMTRRYVKSTVVSYSNGLAVTTRFGEAGTFLVGLPANYADWETGHVRGADPGEGAAPPPGH